MQVVQIIDSLELNGGSTTFLEYVSAMRKYWPDVTVKPYVVSKTGFFGRDNLVNENLPTSYGIDDLQTFSYDTFKDTRESIRDSVIFHHVLGYTKPIKFHKSCKYILVNHTATNIKRLPKFRASVIVCVSGYFTKRVRMQTRIKPLTILNGCEDYFDTIPKVSDSRIIIGRCQRVVPSKLKEVVGMGGCVNYIVGPIGKSFRAAQDAPDKFFVGPVFEKKEKLSWVKSFDIYLHNAGSPEGASMAILEALSCGVPVFARNAGGGVLELVKEGRNGHLFRGNNELKKKVRSFAGGGSASLIASTRKDFLERLHIKHSLKQYRKLVDDRFGESPKRKRQVVSGKS